MKQNKQKLTLDARVDSIDQSQLGLCNEICRLANELKDLKRDIKESRNRKLFSLNQGDVIKIRLCGMDRKVKVLHNDICNDVLVFRLKSGFFFNGKSISRRYDEIIIL